MKQEIKDLRIKIDGLAQLTKHLKPQRLYRLDVAKIPDGWSAGAWLDYFKSTGFAIEDSFNKSNLNEPIIESIPEIHKEIENATNSLYLAKAWLGKVLQELSEEVELSDDNSELTPGLTMPFNEKKQSLNCDTWALNGKSMTFYDNKSHIEKVDWLREEIKNITQKTHVIRDHFEYKSQNDRTSWVSVYTYLTEARFWLGFELQRIKEDGKES